MQERFMYALLRKATYRMKLNTENSCTHVSSLTSVRSRPRHRYS